MNAFLSYVLNSLLVCVEVFALYQLGCCFFEANTRGIKKILLIVGMIISHIIVLVICQGFLPLKVVLFICVDLLWIRILFRPHIFKCFLISVLFAAVMLLGDGVINAGLTVLLAKDPQSVLQNPYAYYAYCFAVKIIELLAIAALRVGMRTKSAFVSSSWRDWLRVTAFPLASTIVALLLLLIFTDTPEASPQIMIGCIILAFADLLSSTLLNYIEMQQQKLHDYSILQHSMELEQDRVEAWMDAYETERRQTHEFHNQLETIRGLALQEGQKTELLSYVSQLLQTETKGLLSISTGRVVADIIHSRKNEIARSKEIQLIVNLDNLRDFPLPDNALSIVMTNLLDNAIEACEKIEDPVCRKINLKIQVEPDVSFFYIDNPTSEPVEIINNHIVTTKDNKASHGYGLKNVAAIMEQYHAYYVLDYQPETSMFCFSAQLTP